MSEKDILHLAIRAIGLHFIHYLRNRILSPEMKDNAPQRIQEDTQKIYHAIADAPNIVNTQVCWNTIVNTCSNFPLSTAAVVHDIIEDTEGKVTALKARYVYQCKEWLNTVGEGSETGLDEWTENWRKIKSIFKGIEEEMLFYAAELKVLREIENAVENKDAAGRIRDSLSEFVARSGGLQ